MRAALVAEGGAFDLVTVDDPVPQAGELLLRITSCGLCGSDLKARGVVPAGSIMGHEFGGQVIGIGPGTAGWAEGAQVAVLPVASCGSCAWCRQGDVVHCGAAQLMGLGGVPGGFAELTVVPAISSFAIPDGVDPVHAALVEPYAEGLHCVRATQLVAGEDVLVIGAGTVGLTTVAWARQRGAGRITVVDPVVERRASAEAFGATDMLPDPGHAIPNTYDIVVECVGKPGLLDQCVAAIRPRGRIVVAGTCAEPDPFWSIAALMKEAVIRFAVYYSPDEFHTVIDAFASGSIDPGPLVGRATALTELNEAFAALAANSTNGRILVTPSRGS
jgi:(R,R)-butanediol dehydrogenase / meso-butanediol dehydrogenase / diacetyl reductase